MPNDTPPPRHAIERERTKLGRPLRRHEILGVFALHDELRRHYDREGAERERRCDCACCREAS